MDRITRRRGGVVLLAAALVVAGLSGATAAKKGLTKKKADKRYINVGEKASDSELLDGIDSTGFLASNGKAADANLLDGMDADAFQASGINDLRAYCALLSEPSNYAPCDTPTITTVDSPGNDVGSHTSVAIGTDGNPVISYFARPADALKVAKCNDPACAGGGETITIVDNPANIVGRYTSIAVGTDGNPVISYHDDAVGGLKVASCNDPACAGGNETITTVDDPAVGDFSSLAIGTDGNPVISYRHITDGALKVVKCDDPACAPGGETITTVDDPGNEVGRHTSIAIGTDGYPVISYQDYTDDDLKVVKCDDPACAGGPETITTVDDDANLVGEFSSIAIGTDGNPVISYYDDTADALKVAACHDPACAGANTTITTVDDPPNPAGRNTSIAIGTDGNPVISYWDITPNGILKLARCNDPACAGGDETITTVDDPAVNNVGEFGSLAIGVDGSPVISYYDETAETLKVAKVPA